MCLITDLPTEIVVSAYYPNGIIFVLHHNHTQLLSPSSTTTPNIVVTFLHHNPTYCFLIPPLQTHPIIASISTIATNFSNPPSLHLGLRVWIDFISFLCLASDTAGAGVVPTHCCNQLAHPETDNKALLDWHTRLHRFAANDGECFYGVPSSALVNNMLECKLLYKHRCEMKCIFQLNIRLVVISGLFYGDNLLKPFKWAN